MENYIRTSLPVRVAKYEPGKQLEDGFELWTKVITNGWITHDHLVQIEREDGVYVCPFIENKRGRLFIREDDYIIFEEDGEKHVCGSEKFFKRFSPTD